MPPVALHLSLLPEQLAVCRFAADAGIPAWALSSSFFSITRTTDELSLVCQAHLVPPDVQCEHGWQAFKLHGPFAFDQIGILVAVLQPLAEAGISIFALSTFDTDCVLVRMPQVAQAVIVLREYGHAIESSDAFRTK